MVAAVPEAATQHLVIHELGHNQGASPVPPRLKDVVSEDYVGLVLPGGRAPEHVRYDRDLVRIVKGFFAAEKPVA